MVSVTDVTSSPLAWAHPLVGEWFERRFGALTERLFVSRSAC
jgi:hypothetical protein